MVSFETYFLEQRAMSEYLCILHLYIVSGDYKSAAVPASCVTLHIHSQLPPTFDCIPEHFPSKSTYQLGRKAEQLPESLSSLSPDAHYDRYPRTIGYFLSSCLI